MFQDGLNHDAFKGRIIEGQVMSISDDATVMRSHVRVDDFKAVAVEHFGSRTAVTGPNHQDYRMQRGLLEFSREAQVVPVCREVVCIGRYKTLDHAGAHPCAIL